MTENRSISIGKRSPKHSGRANQGPRNAHAVIIGINNYQHSGIKNLNYARNDAEGLAAVLRDKAYGYFPEENVTVLVDEQAIRRNIVSAIGTQLKRCAGPDDLVCVFFAGHGATDPDKSSGADGLTKYLLPYDADPNDLYSTGIPMQQVEKFFGRIAARQIVFFLDACYSGGADTFATRSVLNEDFLEKIAKSGEGRLVMTSCRPNEVSLESSAFGGGHGLYSHYLLKGLVGEADINGDGLVTLGELYNYLHKNVSDHARRAGGEMSPIRTGSVQGDIYLTSYQTAAQREAEMLLTQAQADFDAGRFSKAIKAWRKVLSVIPDDEQATAKLASFNHTVNRRETILANHIRTRQLSIKQVGEALTLLKADTDTLSDDDAYYRSVVIKLADEKIDINVFLAIWRSRNKAVLSEPHIPEDPPQVVKSSRENPELQVEQPQPEASSNREQDEPVAKSVPDKIPKSVSAMPEPAVTKDSLADHSPVPENNASARAPFQSPRAEGKSGRGRLVVGIISVLALVGVAIFFFFAKAYFVRPTVKLYAKYPSAKERESSIYTRDSIIINEGESVELKWQSTDATRCEASGAWSGPRAQAGKESINKLTTNTQFILRCSNSKYDALDVISVSVRQFPEVVPAVRLTAAPTSINEGGSVQLTWQSKDATNCAASGDWSGPRAQSGNENILLTADSTFSLTCSGSGGDASASARVEVLPPPGRTDYLPIAIVAPVYSQRLQSRGIEGTCLVEFTVTKQGTVRDPVVIQGQCTSSLFQRPSVEAALKFKYEPRVVNGEAREVTKVRHKFTFSIDKQ